MLTSKKNMQRGETLIEILLAFAILSLALVTVMRTMNGGLNNLFVNGQRSQVEAHMRGQLAILQSAHQKAIANPGGSEAAGWNAIVGNIGADKEKAVSDDGCAYTTDKNRLFFAASGGTSWTGSVGVRSTGALSPSTVTPSPDGNNIWIEARHTPKKDFARGYYDFYIKSCWAGDGGVEQEAKMVTRLYDLEANVAPVYDNMEFAASSTGCSNNINASNARIAYTLRNPNDYPLGIAKVYVNNVLVGTHTMGPNAVYNVTTPAGYNAGNYEVKVTLNDAGSDTRTISIVTCLPSAVSWWGSNDSSCRTFGGFDVDCERIATYLWQCVPYNVNYASGSTILQEGTGYSLQVSYGNYTGGGCGAWPYNYQYYAYTVNVYINGVYCTQANLLNTMVDREQTIPLPCQIRNNGSQTQGPVVRLEWINDWYDGVYDANLRINWVRLAR